MQQSQCKCKIILVILAGNIHVKYTIKYISTENHRLILSQELITCQSSSQSLSWSRTSISVWFPPSLSTSALKKWDLCYIFSQIRGSKEIVKHQPYGSVQFSHHPSCVGKAASSLQQGDAKFLHLDQTLHCSKHLSFEFDKWVDLISTTSATLPQCPPSSASESCQPRRKHFVLSEQILAWSSC